MRALWQELGRLHPLLGWTARGVLVLGALGMLFGLLVGTDHLQTIWAAALEGGFLGALAGCALGLAAGCLAWLAHALRRRLG